MSYEIAKYLTPEEKSRALKSTYVAHPGSHQPRDGAGYCPLGRALDTQIAAPPAAIVADAIAVRRLGARSYADVYEAAARFIGHWDSGRLPPSQLAEALGVEVPA